jgi:hypothetical protein
MGSNAINCAWAPMAVPYLHYVTSASISLGRGAGCAYPIHGRARVRRLDARVPPGSMLEKGQVDQYCGCTYPIQSWRCELNNVDSSCD